MDLICTCLWLLYLSLPHTHSLSHAHKHIPSLSLPHTHSLSHTHKHIPSLSLPHITSLSLSHIPSLTHTNTHPLSLSLPHTPSLSHSHRVSELWGWQILQESWSGCVWKRRHGYSDTSRCLPLLPALRQTWDTSIPHKTKVCGYHVLMESE